MTLDPHVTRNTSEIPDSPVSGTCKPPAVLCIQQTWWPCRVFSVEKDISGRRGFIVTSYDEFWRQYHQMPLTSRHYYEIIREGLPCHLYFDLEFKVDFNPSADGQALVDLVISLTTRIIKEKFAIDLRPENILELDSSSTTKFSRHLIILLPGAAFRSNAHAGVLIEEVCSCAASGSNSNTSSLTVSKDAEGEQTCFIDQGVYSKNRAFRLMLSSKAGKETTLQPTGRLRPIVALKKTFMESLICYVAPDAKLLTCFEGDSMHPIALRRGRSETNIYATSAQAGPCPFPEIAAFITSVCNQEGAQGFVRSWIWSPEASLLLLNMAGNRFCANVGRQHRSNGIYYCVDLQDRVWFQKCYDPDCKGFRSAVMPLPREMRRLVRDATASVAMDNAVASPCSNYLDSDVWPDEGAAVSQLEELEQQMQLAGKTLPTGFRNLATKLETTC